MIRILPIRCVHQGVTDIGGAVFEQGFVHAETVRLGKLRGKGDDCTGIALAEGVALP